MYCRATLTANRESYFGCSRYATRERQLDPIPSTDSSLSERADRVHTSARMQQNGAVTVSLASGLSLASTVFKRERSLTRSESHEGDQDQNPR